MESECEEWWVLSPEASFRLVGYEGEVVCDTNDLETIGRSIKTTLNHYRSQGAVVTLLSKEVLKREEKDASA